MGDTLNVNEIYLSLQGESTFAGLPCIFVRLTGCNLRCSYCDTAYAFFEGTKVAEETIVERVLFLAKPFGSPSGSARLPLIELTGGEPLLQSGSSALMRIFCDLGFTVLLETSGAWDISALDPRIRRIVDLKCPSSGESHRNHLKNLQELKPTDEVKFVIASQEDFQWAKGQIRDHQLASRCPLLFSWAAPLQPHQQHSSLKHFPPDHTPLSKKALAEQIIRDCLPVRFQVQMHKVIWSPDQRGV